MRRRMAAGGRSGGGSSPGGRRQRTTLARAMRSLARATALWRKLYLMGREFAWKLYKEDIAQARAVRSACVLSSRTLLSNARRFSGAFSG